MSLVPVLLLLNAAVTLGAPAPELELDALVAVSESIVVARVAELHEIRRYEPARPVSGEVLADWLRTERAQVAELAVEQVLMGEPGLATVLVAAQHADDPHATRWVAGDRMVVFLAAREAFTREGESFRRIRAAKLGDELVHTLAGGEAGLVHLLEDEALAWRAPALRVPAELEVAGSRRVAERTLFAVARAPLLERVRVRVEETTPRLAVMWTSTGPQGSASFALDAFGRMRDGTQLRPAVASSLHDASAALFRLPKRVGRSHGPCESWTSYRCVDAHGIAAVELYGLRWKDVPPELVPDVKLLLGLDRRLKLVLADPRSFASE